LLETDRTAYYPHMVAAFIADRLGGVAKHLALTRLIDPACPEFADDEVDCQHRFRLVDPVLACRRVRLAIERPDADPSLPVSDTFADCRALAIARTKRRLSGGQ
jgi:hypothetical protein